MRNFYLKMLKHVGRRRTGRGKRCTKTGLTKKETTNEATASSSFTADSSFLNKRSRGKQQQKRNSEKRVEIYTM